jgi:hypothetical protein
MEPAGDRLDDLNPLGVIPVVHIAPQWSQPKIGWMTNIAHSAAFARAIPQWSQPGIGWKTTGTSPNSGRISGPQ